MGHDKKTHTLGMDVGGTKILVALLDEDFHIVSEVKTKTKPEKGVENFQDTIEQSVTAVLKDAHISADEVIGAGIGCPGFINPQTGVVASSANIAFLKSYPMAKIVSQLIDVPVTVGNDVQTGLFGEQQFGAAKGYQNVVGIFLGTGVGGAMILDGHLYRGSSGSAGEVGHMRIDPLGPQCGCGRRGCLESYTGRLAIAAEAASAVARGKAPNLEAETGTDIRKIKSGALARAIKAGDGVIEDLIRDKARIIGGAMGSLVNILNPEMIVLGGGLVESMPNLIVREAEDAMRNSAVAGLVKNVKVAAAKLGDYSIVMGAAKRAKDRFGETDHG